MLRGRLVEAAGRCDAVTRCTGYRSAGRGTREGVDVRVGYESTESLSQLDWQNGPQPGVVVHDVDLLSLV